MHPTEPLPPEPFDPDDAALEPWLRCVAPLAVPKNFSARVMEQVRVAPAVALRAPGADNARTAWPAVGRALRPALQWLALGGGFAIGAVQASAFVFGMWAATVVG